MHLIRYFIVIFVMVAFQGQAVSYAFVSCEMPLEDHYSGNTSAQSKMSEHADMAHMDHDLAEETMQHDCCDVQCSCPENACTSAVFITSADNAFVSVVPGNSTFSLEYSLPDTTLSSLYRPPISA